jgi:hypothetical protein
MLLKVGAIGLLADKHKSHGESLSVTAQVTHQPQHNRNQSRGDE